MKTETCFTRPHKSLIDLLLTNKPLSLQKMHATETSLSGYHKLISTFFKSHFTRQRPKVITYKNYKKFDEDDFLNDLQKLEIKLDEENSESCYSLISNKFSRDCKQTCSVKEKVLRGNHFPFQRVSESYRYLHKKQIEKQNESKTFLGKCIGI